MIKSYRPDQVKTLWDKGLSNGEISKELGILPCNVSTYLKKLYGNTREKRFNYKRRVFTLNESFFETIDTEAKAYFLGLLAADGNLSTSQNSVRIGLHEKDKEILETFRRCLNYTKPLAYVNKSIVDWNRSNQYLLEISSSIFRKTLEKHGLTPNKSATLKFPTTLLLNVIHHYIRGYFDGDGCIHIDKRNHAGISIAGSLIFCENLKSVLETFNIRSSVTKHYKVNCYYVRSFGQSNILQFYNFMYEDATIFLNRKKEIFETWINKQNDTRTKKNNTYS